MGTLLELLGGFLYAGGELVPARLFALIVTVMGLLIVGNVLTWVL